MSKKILCGWCGEPSKHGLHKRCTEAMAQRRSEMDQRNQPILRDHQRKFIEDLRSVQAIPPSPRGFGKAGALQESLRQAVISEAPVTKPTDRFRGEKFPGTRFQINTDGIVYDTWNGLEWQREVSAEAMDWEQAKAYAASLDLDGGGWRLPTIEELFCLADRSRRDPSIDTKAFPKCPRAFFWSATLYKGDSSQDQDSPEYTWAVSFHTGFPDRKGNGYCTARVRCVR